MHLYDEHGNPTLIDWFDDFGHPHPFVALSNFFVGQPIYLGVVDDYFPSGEHAFAAMKAYRGGMTMEYHAIREAATPDEAKMLGRTCRLRKDWEVVKYDLMMAILRAKFTLDRYEGEVLLSTGDALLVEGTYWDDRVWGVSLNETENALVSPGRNWLGTMLMARRAELRVAELAGLTHSTGVYNQQFVVR